jgi:PHD/YefM family antitoxin component YafN of YafNO toxin-antitoxin module
MKRVSTVELIRNFGAHSDAALATPIIVTKNGRDRLVLISIEQYDMLQHAYDAFEDTHPKAAQERAKPARVNATGRRKG